VIVSCGEALFDVLVQPEQVGAPTAWHPVAGGGPFNSAIALARLGVAAGFLGRLSNGPLGQRLVDHLQAEGVSCRYVTRSDAPTALALVDRPTTGSDVSYTFYMDGTAERGLLTEHIDEITDDVAALHFGTLGLVLEPMASTLLALMMQQQGRRLISLDPNVRARLIGDPAAYRARIEAAVAMADVVKVSDADAEWLDAGGDIEALVARWRASGPAMLVLTRGADGATAWCGEHRVDVPAVPVVVTDTVGAGDTFDAGVLCWLAEHGRLHRHGVASLDRPQLDAMVRFAAACAAVTVSRAGADPPTRAEVNPPRV
jgi:fructokinase